jgi:hypothetical protein
MTETGKNGKPEKWGSKMASILPTSGTCVNYGRGFFSSARSEQKPLSDFENSFPFSRNPPSEVDWSKLAKKVVFEFGGAVLQG